MDFIQKKIVKLSIDFVQRLKNIVKIFCLKFFQTLVIKVGIGIVYIDIIRINNMFFVYLIRIIYILYNISVRIIINNIKNPLLLLQSSIDESVVWWMQQ